MATRAQPRRLGRPPAVDSTVTRERILTAARRSFATRGYDATTNRDIAAEAGVTTGALYHYTRSKADLYGEVYAEVQDLVYGEFEKAFAHDSFRARFGAVLDAAVALNERDPSLAGFVIGVSPEVQRHPELRDKLRPWPAARPRSSTGWSVTRSPPASWRPTSTRRPSRTSSTPCWPGWPGSRTSPATPTATRPRPRSCTAWSTGRSSWSGPIPDAMMQGMPDAPTQVPVADGLFTWPDESPQLIGSHFPESGVVTFPRQSSCPRTSSTVVEDVLLPRRGRLWSWTVQGFLPKSPPYAGRETPQTFVPYGVGYVELESGDGGVIVESRLTENDPDRLRIGMPVELVIVPFTTDDEGREVVTFAFAPVADTASADSEGAA